MPGKKPSKSAINKRLLAETQKQVRAVAREIKKTGHLRSANTGRFIKATTRNVTNKALGKAAKKTGVEIKRDSRQIVKTAKAASKLFAELKKALTPKRKPVKSAPQQSKPTKIPAKKTAPSKPLKTTPKKQTPKSSQPKKPTAQKSASRSYDLIDLPESFNNATLFGTLEELKENGPGYDSFKKPGDVWGMRIGYRNENGNFVGGYSYTSFETFAQMIDTLEKYKSVQDFGGDPPDENGFAGIVKLIRFRAKGPGVTRRASEDAWSARKNVELGKRKERAKKYKSERRELEKRAKRETRARIDAQAELDRARREVKHLQSQIQFERKQRSEEKRGKK